MIHKIITSTGYQLSKVIWRSIYFEYFWPGISLPRRSARQELELFLTETFLLCSDGLSRRCQAGLEIIIRFTRNGIFHRCNV